MTVPAAPLPSLASLVQALSSSESSGQPWCGINQAYAPRFYHRGRMALAAGIDAAREAARSTSITVWLPDYFCNEALYPLRQLPSKINFYPIKADLTPDFAQLTELTKCEVGPHVLVVVHYFGFPNATGKARSFCDKYGFILIEDAAHMLCPADGTGAGELMILSPRKVLALPSGGLLLARREFISILKEAPGESNLPETISWIMSRLTQKTFLKLHIPWHQFRANADPHNESDGGAAAGSNCAEEGANLYSLRLLKVVEPDFGETVARRRANYERLLELVKGLDQLRPVFSRLPNDVCPYALPIVVKNGCQDIVMRLKVSGVMASRWPDLPPEVTGRPANHAVAVNTYQQLMLLPIHQSLRAKDIDVIGRNLRRIIGKC